MLPPIYLHRLDLLLLLGVEDIRILASSSCRSVRTSLPTDFVIYSHSRTLSSRQTVHVASNFDARARSAAFLRPLFYAVPMAGILLLGFFVGSLGKNPGYLPESLKLQSLPPRDNLFRN